MLFRRDRFVVNSDPVQHSANDICKLEYYYVLQVYWEFAVFGVANWRQSARPHLMFIVIFVGIHLSGVVASTL
jgi:hypothetical protein